MPVGDSFGDLSRLMLAEEAQRRAGLETALSRMLASIENARRRQTSNAMAQLARADQQQARALDEAYRRDSLAQNALQFKLSQYDRQAARVADDAYRRDALAQSGELGRAQLDLYRDQIDAQTRATDATRSTDLFRQIWSPEQIGVNMADAVRDKLTPEQLAQIDALRATQNQAFTAQNSIAEAAARQANETLSSKLRMQAADKLSTISRLTDKLMTAPEQEPWHGFGRTRSEIRNLVNQTAQEVADLKDQLASQLRSSDDGLGKLTTYERDRGFVPITKPLRPLLTTSAGANPAPQSTPAPLPIPQSADEEFVLSDNPPDPYSLPRARTWMPAEPPAFIPTDVPPDPYSLPRARTGMQAAPPAGMRQVGSYVVPEWVAAHAAGVRMQALAAGRTEAEANALAEQILRNYR